MPTTRLPRPAFVGPLPTARQRLETLLEPVRSHPFRDAMARELWCRCLDRLQSPQPVLDLSDFPVGLVMLLQPAWLRAHASMAVEAGMSVHEVRLAGVRRMPPWLVALPRLRRLVLQDCEASFLDLRHLVTLRQLQVLGSHRLRQVDIPHRTTPWIEPGHFHLDIHVHDPVVVTVRHLPARPAVPQTVRVHPDPGPGVDDRMNLQERVRTADGRVLGSADLVSLWSFDRRAHHTRVRDDEVGPEGFDYRSLATPELLQARAGQALALLGDEIAAGAVPGIDSLDAMFSDEIHLGGKGQYFVAMVIAGAVAGQSPEGLPAKLTRSWANRDAHLTEDQARALQRVAWAAVSAGVPTGATLAPEAAPDPEPAAAIVADPAPVAPAAEPAPMPVFAPITNPNLAFGLAGVNDWSVQQPFLDVMKTARPWVGHLPGQWGGWEHDDLAAKGYLDANGWPKSLPPELSGLSTLILTDLPADAGGVAGRYVLTWQGQGTLAVEGRAKVVEAAPGRILFDYTPGDGFVAITLTALDASDPIHAISVVRADREAALAAGQIFQRIAETREKLRPLGELPLRPADLVVRPQHDAEHEGDERRPERNPARGVGARNKARQRAGQREQGPQAEADPGLQHDPGGEGGRACAA